MKSNHKELYLNSSIDDRFNLTLMDARSGSKSAIKRNARILSSNKLNRNGSHLKNNNHDIM